MLSASKAARVATPYLLVLPAVALVLGLTVYPTLNIVGTSLSDWQVNRPEVKFIGLENYSVLLRDPHFWGALRNTATLGLTALLCTLVLSTLLAFALSERIPFRTFLRVAIVLPWAVTGVVTGVMWRWLVTPDIGLVPYAFDLLFGQRLSILLDARTGMALLIGVAIWRSTGYATVVLLAGLQSIEPSLREAAFLDGATYWRYMRAIAIPLITPVIVIVAILITLQTVNLIDLALVVTGGNPARQTEVLGLFMWTETFTNFRIAFGSAIAIVMFTLNLGLSLLYVRAISSR